MIVHKEKLLRKSSNRKWKLDLSKLVTTWLSNIAFHLQPIWLQTLVAIWWSIQNHTRHRFQAFARRHVKSLCCSIRIWAGFRNVLWRPFFLAVSAIACSRWTTLTRDTCNLMQKQQLSASAKLNLAKDTQYNKLEGVGPLHLLMVSSKRTRATIDGFIKGRQGGSREHVRPLFLLMVSSKGAEGAINGCIKGHQGGRE